MLTIDADDILDGLIDEQVADDAERDALMIEAHRHVFGADECPPLSHDLTLWQLWEKWLTACDASDAWYRLHAARLRELGDQLRAMPRGRGAMLATAPIRKAIEDAKWRQNAARHALYSSYAYRQQQMTDFFKEAWTESGFHEDHVEDLMDELGCIIAERRALEWAGDKRITAPDLAGYA